MKKLIASTVSGAVLSAALGVCLLGGCKDSSMKDDGMMKSDAKMMSTDVCPSCKGVQHATTDGKCSMCGAKVQ